VRLGEVVHGLDLDSEGRSVRSLRLASSESRPVGAKFRTRLRRLANHTDFARSAADRASVFRWRRGAARTILHGAFDGRSPASSCMIRARSRTLTTASTKTVTGIVEDSAFPLRFNGRTNSSHRVLAGKPSFHDPSHGSAAASSIYLNLNLPIARMKYFSSDFVSFHRGNGPLEFRKHLANILGDPKGAARGLATAVKYQLSRDNLKPFFVRNSRGSYSLHYHSEQIPDASTAFD